MTEEERAAAEASLPESVVRNAKKAYCSHCKVKILESTSPFACHSVKIKVPTEAGVLAAFLCGPCSLTLREFMWPELLENEEWKSAARRLRELW